MPGSEADLSYITTTYFMQQQLRQETRWPVCRVATISRYLRCGGPSTCPFRKRNQGRNPTCYQTRSGDWKS